MSSTPTPTSPGTDPGPAPSRPRVRRAPRLVPFLTAGAVVGATAGALLHLLGTTAEHYSRTSQLLYLMVLLAIFGVLLGGIAYLVADRAAGPRDSGPRATSGPTRDRSTADPQEAAGRAR